MRGLNGQIGKRFKAILDECSSRVVGTRIRSSSSAKVALYSSTGYIRSARKLRQSMELAKKIDVVLCTWNSNKPYFPRCLNSIKINVPIHHLIVVDRFSEDNTIDVIKHSFPTALIIQTGERVARARKIGIDAVDTEYFAFIDDDAELREGWFRKLIEHFSDEKVGAVQDFTRYYIEFMDKLALRLLKRTKPVQEVTFRGHTGNSIFRTKVVEDWSPPKSAVAWEDYLLTQHVLSKGYKWLLIRDAQMTHFANVSSYHYEVSEVLRNLYVRAVWSGAWGRLLGETNLKIGVRNLVLYVLEGTRASIGVLNPLILAYYVCRGLGELDGILNAQKPYFTQGYWIS